MSLASGTILATLVVFQLVLLGIGWWASGRTRNEADFYLAGRRLGPWVTALSATASSSSAWTLLGVSGAAYLWGWPAIWILPGVLGGMLFNFFWLAPRLWRTRRNSVTVTDYLVEGMSAREARPIRWLAALVVLFSFTFYVAAQFQAAGHAFASAFSLSPILSLLIGGTVVAIYTLIGGFWAVSLTDTLQGLLMALAALILPALGLTVAGWGPITSSLGSFTIAGNDSAGIAALGFVFGMFAIGLGYPGQPHVLVRFFAASDMQVIRRSQRIATVWAILIYTGMLLTGWSARVLLPEIGDGEQAFFALARELLPAVLAGVMIAAVLSAIMSTADSQLLVAASSVSHDMAQHHSIGAARLMVGLLCVGALLLALFAPEAIFDRVLFAWAAIGAAFAPAIIALALRRAIAPPWLFASIAVGFGLTVALYWLPDTPGDWLERIVPWLAAGLLAWHGSRERDEAALS